MAQRRRADPGLPGKRAFSSEKQEQLSLFQCFLDNELDRSDAERRMLFSQGFSIGLRLGALSARA